MSKQEKLLSRKKRLLEIIEVGAAEDLTSRLYDILNSLAIVVNLTVSILYTFAELRGQYGSWLTAVEGVTVAFFAVDYCLRLWTSPCLHPKLAPGKAAVDGKQLRLSAVRAPGGDIILLLRDVTRQEERRSAAEKLQAESLRAAQQAADRQIRMAQRVAALLGESAGETKAALLRLEAGLKGRQEEKGED